MGHETENFDKAPHLVTSSTMLAADNAPEMLEEQLPTTRTRRYWLYTVYFFTWFIPDFLLSGLGRMKRPDVRLAWREKLTICLLILFGNGLILFYIIAFGVILCPNFKYAWTTNEVAQYTGNTDYYVSIQGKVYDVSNFVFGDHSDIVGEASNGAATLAGLAGTDMTYYFPPPLNVACAGLVSDPTMKITPENNTLVLYPTAMHSSGSNAPTTPTALDNQDWYTATFIPKISQYHIGPLVWEPSDIYSQANQTTNPR